MRRLKSARSRRKLYRRTGMSFNGYIEAVEPKTVTAVLFRTDDEDEDSSYNAVFDRKHFWRWRDLLNGQHITVKIYPTGSVTVKPVLQTVPFLGDDEEHPLVALLKEFRDVFSEEPSPVVKEVS